MNRTTEILVGTVSNGFLLDISKEESININYSIADIRGINNRNSTFTKTIKVPATTNNNKCFSHLFEIGVDSSFNPNLKTPAVIMVDTIEVLNGYLQLTNIEVDWSKNIANYELVIYGNNFNFLKTLGEDKVVDLDWSGFTHNKDQISIEESWFPQTYHRPYVYPLIDTGYGWQYPDCSAWGSTPINYDNLKPAFFVKQIVDKIFSAHSYSYTSTFLNSDFFKKLVYFPPGLTGRALEADVYLDMALQFPFTSSVFNGSISLAGTAKVFSENPSTGARTLLLSPFFFLAGSSAGATSVNITTAGTFLLNPADKIFVEIETQVITNSNNFNFAINLNGSATSGKGLKIVYRDSTNVQGEIFVGSTLSNIPLSSAQVLTTRMMFNNETTPYYDTYNTWNTTLGEHIVSTSVIYNHIPSNLSQVSFLSDILKCFNLYIDIDKNSSGNNLIIEPRNQTPFSPSYYSLSDKIRDWTSKIDISRPLNIQLLSELQNKKILFSMQEDSDYLNDKYKNDTNEVYSQHLLELENDFLTGTMEIKPANFAGTPLQQIPTSNGLLIPRIYGRQDNINLNIVEPEPSTGYKGRLLFYHGFWDIYFINSESIKIDYGQGQYSTLTAIPFATEWYGPTPFYPSMSLNWGTPKEAFYSTPFAAFLGAPQENLFTTFYKDYINGIVDKNSKMITAYFNLEPSDIASVRFNDVIFLKDQYYILNKIEYNALGNSLSKVELLLLTNQVRSLKDNKLIGERKGATPTTGGLGNVMGPFSTTIGRSNFSQNVFNSLISGNHNYINTNTNNVFIQGNNNLISGGYFITGGTSGGTAYTISNISVIAGSFNSAYTSNTVFINGSGNTTNTASNVTLIGMNNFSGATSANTVYVPNMVILSGLTVFGGISGLEQYWKSGSTGSNSLLRNYSSGNTASGNFGLTASGSGNTNSGRFSSILNGRNNSLGDFNFQTVLNGIGNTSSNHYTTIFNGKNNTASGLGSIVFGSYSVASGAYSMSFGGSNISSGVLSVTMGKNNKASGNYSFVLGAQNSGTSTSAVVFGYACASTGFNGGGLGNIAESRECFIGNGLNNKIIGSGSYSATILNGRSNHNYSYFSTILQGISNSISSTAQFSTILNGKFNSISGLSKFSSIIAGTGNTISDSVSSSITAGNNINATLSATTFTQNIKHLGGVYHKNIVVTSNYNASSEDYLIAVSGSSATTIYLPSVPIDGHELIFKDLGLAATFNITLVGNIDGASSYVLNQNFQSANLIYSQVLSYWVKA